VIEKVKAGLMVRPSRTSCGVPSLVRPVSIGHLGVEPKLCRLARFDGLTMGIFDECSQRLIEIDFYGERTRPTGQAVFG
jgi:hypothetical protein